MGWDGLWGRGRSNEFGGVSFVGIRGALEPGLWSGRVC